MSKYTATQTKQLQEIGTYLRQQRLERSLSLEQIASNTFIRLPILKALEEGQVTDLPELIYVQGFIRRYGEALNLDGSALVKRISPPDELTKAQISPQLVTATTPENSSNHPTSSTPPIVSRKSSASVPAKEPMGVKRDESVDNKASRFKGWKLYSLYLLLIVSAVVGLFEVLSRPHHSETTSPPPRTVKVAPSPAPSASSAPPASPAPSPTNEQTSPASVSLQLEDDSWVSVQVDGKTEYEGILEKGSQKSWTAQENLTLRAGNAGAIKISINHQPPELLGNLGEVKEVTVTPNKSNF